MKAQILEKLKETDGFRSFYSRHLKLTPTSATQVRALCPFHNDQNPSLSINLANGLYHCFACPAKGNIFNFRMKAENLSFADCLKAFANELQLIPKEIKPLTLTVLPAMKNVLEWQQNLFKDQNKTVREFLNAKRGMTDETIRQFHLGFDERSGSIVVPVLDPSGQEAVAAKLLKYDLSTGKKTIRTIGSAQLFNSHLLLRDYEKFGCVVICEGEFDAIVLCQNGFLAVSGTAGASTWKKAWSPSFKGKDVVLCYDSDDAGRKGASRVAQELLPIASSVKSIDLFGSEATKDRKDATDFFVKAGKTAEDFQRMVDSADPVQSSCTTDQSSIMRALEEEVQVRRVNPAQDCVAGVFYYAVRIRNKLHLLTSERECIPFGECERRGIALTTKHVDDCRMSARAIISFLRAERQVDPYRLFSDIRSYIKQYIVLKSPDAYDYLSLWTLGTSVFTCFRYYPYVHLRGEKRSGKTLLLQVLSAISFNGQVSLNPTEAVIFRDVHNNAPTLLLDEVELFRKQDTERYGAIMSVLKAGFAKGAVVKRCGGVNRDKIETFLAYSPKALAGISTLDDVLQDRTVGIRMLRKLETEQVDRYLENAQTVEFQNQIRDDLYFFGLTYGTQIAETYSEKLSDVTGLEHLNNREFDIWAPIIVLANLVDDVGGLESSPVTNTIIRFSKVKAAERKQDDSTENETVLILVALNDFLNSIGSVATRGKLKLLDKNVVFDHFKARDEFSWIETKSYLTRMLKKVEVVAKNFTIDGKTHSYYVLDPDLLADYTRRYVPQAPEM